MRQESVFRAALRSPLAVVASLAVSLFGQQSLAQQLDLNALQNQADAAIAQVQSELRNTEATILVARTDAQSDWVLTISGLLAGVQTDYTGTIISIDNSSGTPTLVTQPPVPASSASADLSEGILSAAAVVLLDVDDFVIELSFVIDAPLDDTADPAILDGVDVTTLAKHIITQTTTRSPELSLTTTTGSLSTADSYFKIAADYGLTKTDLQLLFAGELDEAEVIEAFRKGAVSILSSHGVSQASASDIYELRRSLGDTPLYYQQALALLINAGEPVASLIANGMPIDDPEGPLARVGDPGDLEIELYGETEVEVSVPPFVKVKVKVGLKVKGKLSDLAAMQEALNAALEQAAREAKQQAEKQLQYLKQAIEELVELFKDYLDSLEIPSWVRWLLV